LNYDHASDIRKERISLFIDSIITQSHINSEEPAFIAVSSFCIQEFSRIFYSCDISLVCTFVSSSRLSHDLFLLYVKMIMLSQLS
jgi:hypothetical protein